MNVLKNLVMAAALVAASASASAANLNAWGAMDVGCGGYPHPSEPPEYCVSFWAPIVAAEGEFTVDLATRSIYMHALVWTQYYGGPYSLQMDADLVDAAPNFSGDAVLIDRGDLHAVLLKVSDTGAWKFGSEELGFFIRAQ